MSRQKPFSKELFCDDAHRGAHQYCVFTISATWGLQKFTTCLRISQQPYAQKAYSPLSNKNLHHSENKGKLATFEENH